MPARMTTRRAIKLQSMMVGIQVGRISLRPISMLKNCADQPSWDEADNHAHVKRLSEAFQDRDPSFPLC
jgi:hypothetical protein